MLKPCFTPSTALRYTRNTTKTFAWGRHLCRAHAGSSWEFAPAPQREQPRHKRVQRDNRGRDYRDQRERRDGRERRDYRDRAREVRDDREDDNYGDARKYREGREYREREDYREQRGYRGQRDHREVRDYRERDYGGNRSQRDQRDNRDYRDYRDYGNKRNERGGRESRPPSTNPETEIIRAAQATTDDLLYGINAVLQALLSGKRAHYSKVYIQTSSTDRARHTRITKHAKEAGIPIIPLSKHGLNTLSDNRPHQGVILSTAGIDIPVMTSLVDCKGVWLALDEVTDPHNVGAIIRSAVFLGARGVILCKRNCCGVTAAVAKASSGAVEICDIRGVGSMPRFLKGVKEEGWQVVGLGVGGSRVRDVKVGEDGVILVLGSEGRGLRKMVAECCEEIVGIEGGGNDMGEVDSLNVSVAAGVALFELLRGR